MSANVVLVAESLAETLTISEKLATIDLRRVRGDARTALRQARSDAARLAQQLQVALQAGSPGGPPARPSPPEPP